jgi:small neutral amino acid transporter SnatA (MarC family)
MRFSDPSVVAKVAAATMAKPFFAAPPALSSWYPVSVDRSPWSMTGVFVAILAVAAVATRFFVAAALLRHLRAIEFNRIFFGRV